MFLQETEVDFFFKFLIILALFWQKVLKIGLFFLEKRKVDFHQNFQCFQGVLAKSLENLTIFGQFFKKIPKNHQFFQNLQGFTRFVAKFFEN